MDEAILQGGVFTTSELKGYGVICSLVVFMFFIICFMIWSRKVLEPSNEVHLFALHYTYQPRINRNLNIFTQGHSRGPISSERGKSPMQLWIQGSMTHSSRAIDEQWSLVSTKFTMIDLIYFTRRGEDVSHIKFY